jgi:hypothetical protein
MTRLPVVEDHNAPLCQQGGNSCAACCGVYNFADRSSSTLQARLAHRTRRVAAAGWDEAALREAARDLAQEEEPLLLFKAVKTCPLAGFIDDGHTRVGCLIHPLRHPKGQDLRDLGAYHDRGICEGHLCAPHQWLTSTEKVFLRCASNWQVYSMGIGECGFLKAALTWVANRRGAEVQVRDFARPGAVEAASSLLSMWEAWPFVDPDPRRFGGFSFAGDDAYTREVPSVARFASVVTAQEGIMLDALGTLAPDEETARAAVELLRKSLQRLADVLAL